MTDTQKKPLWKNELVWLFLITSGLFAILYSKFILGGYAYVFTDTGADTMQINYAQYGLFSSLFRSGESGYVLQAGLGMDVSSYYPAYLIPYNLLILLAPQRLLPWAVLDAVLGVGARPQAEAVMMFGCQDHSFHTGVDKGLHPLLTVQTSRIKRFRIGVAIAPFPVIESIETEMHKGISFHLLPIYLLFLRNR